MDFPGGSPVVKTSPFNAGDASSIPNQGTKSTCQKTNNKTEAIL